MPVGGTRTLADRAADYFGVHDLPRTSIRVSDKVCLIVLERGGKTSLHVYDESWEQRGRIARLTPKQRDALVAALQGSQLPEEGR